MRRMSKRESRRREIERLLSLRRSQGLSLRTLSERSGIPPGTLSWWSHKLRSESTSEAGRAFVELVPTQAADWSHAGSSANVGRETSAELRIRHPSGAIVEFSGDLAEAVTERIVAELGPWS